MLLVKSQMFGTVQLSRTVALFRWQKSPQGCQEPSGFGTIWRADDQGKLLRLTIPTTSIFSNLALAAAYFCRSSWRARVENGRPRVLVANIVLDRTRQKTKANNLLKLRQNFLICTGNLGEERGSEEDNIRGRLTSPVTELSKWRVRLTSTW